MLHFSCHFDAFLLDRTHHPLYHILHDEPNIEMTSFVFRETLMGHLLIWGNAYAQIIRDGAGRVMALSTVAKQDGCEQG